MSGIWLVAIGSLHLVALDCLPGTFFGPNTLVELVRLRAERQPDDVAFTYLVDGEGQQVEITYAELDRRARAIGAWLGSLGLTGQRALLLHPAGLEFIVAFFGCLYGGVVAVPAYPPRRNRSLARIEAISGDCGARVALSTGQVLRRVGAVVRSSPVLRRLQWLATCDCPSAMADSWQPPDIDAATLAFLQYTSGSTGTPKGVMLTHANLIHNSALIAYAFEHTRSGLGVFWLPSYHDMGLIGGVLQPLYCGRPNILMSPMAFLQKPLRWLAAVSRFRATTSGGPNFAYDLCVRSIGPDERRQLDLSSWEVAFNGAEPVQEETIERFCEAFEPCGFRREAFYPCYGLAEATLIVSGGYVHQQPVIRAFDAATLADGRAVDAKQGARPKLLVGCGSTLPDEQIVIVDPQSGRQLPDGSIGEIWVRGPSVAQGYWNRPEATEETFHARLAGSGEGPFLRTGDLGFLRDGELFVTGRIKDVIILRGANFYPQDIERTVQQSHPRLRPDCGAAFTVAVDGRERLVVVHEVQRRKRGELGEVFAAIRRAVAAEHDFPPETIVLVRAGTIPKTSSGKIQRDACRRAFLEGRLKVVARWDAGHRQTDAEWPEAPGPGSPPRSADEGTIHSEPHAFQGTRIAETAWTVCSADRGNGEPDKAQGPRSGGNGRASGDGRDLASQVLEEVARVAKDRAAGLTLETNIREIGLDSLERVKIVTALEERFGGRFPEEVLFELETCGQVVEAVERYLGGGHSARSARGGAKPIAEEAYRPERFPEYVQLRQHLEVFRAIGLLPPQFTPHEGRTGSRTTVDGRQLIDFAHHDYLGLAGEPAVIRAVQEAVQRYGATVAASPMVGGQRQVHRDLECALAELLGTQDALVVDGASGAIQALLAQLFDRQDLILYPTHAHSGIRLAAAMAGADRRRFPQQDWQAADRLLDQLRGSYRRAAVVIEGVSLLDGAVAELPQFIEIKRRHKALLVVDQSHSLGTIGPSGRGIGEHFGLEAADVDAWTGSFSYALANAGSWVAGSGALVQLLRYTAPAAAATVAMAPSAAAGALAAIRLLKEQPERVERLQRRAKQFVALARQRGLDTGPSQAAPIVPIVLGSSSRCVELTQALRDCGIYVPAILYPAVDEEAARLRFCLSAAHTAEQIHYAVDALASQMARLRGGRMDQTASEVA
ncbi:MAG TPA: aminotransferase class I/II-fold pyridoxal phosphate-dependent enzyme [Planctomycetes bacterium]|nr:aminotransferase class I/II-fold pyridoxal phosphate-dependent enzyme [Planctomycetota bacterium]